MAIKQTSKNTFIENQCISHEAKVLDRAQKDLGIIERYLTQLLGCAQSASAKGLTNSQREHFNHRFSEIRAKIEAVSSTSQFDGHKILDGSYSRKIAVGSGRGSSLHLHLKAMGVEELGIAVSQLSSRDAAMSAVEDIQSALELVRTQIQGVRVQREALSAELKAHLMAPSDSVNSGDIRLERLGRESTSHSAEASIGKRQIRRHLPKI